MDITTDLLKHSASLQRKLTKTLALSKIRVVFVQHWAMRLSDLIARMTAVGTPYELAERGSPQTATVLEAIYNTLLSEYRQRATIAVPAGVSPRQSEFKLAVLAKIQTEINALYEQWCMRRVLGMTAIVSMSLHSVQLSSIPDEPHKLIDAQREAERVSAALKEEPYVDFLSDDYDLFDSSTQDRYFGVQTPNSAALEEPLQKIPIFLGHSSELRNERALAAVCGVERALQLTLYAEKTSSVRVFVTLSRKNIALIVCAIIDTLAIALPQTSATLKSDLVDMCAVLFIKLTAEQQALEAVLAETRSTGVPILHFHIDAIASYDFSACAKQSSASHFVDAAMSKYTLALHNLISAKVLSLLTNKQPLYKKFASSYSNILVDVACDEHDYTLIRLQDVPAASLISDPQKNKDYKNEQDEYARYHTENTKYRQAFPGCVGLRTLMQLPTITLWSIPTAISLE